MNYLIGVDIGTGSTKAVAISPDGTILHSESVSYPIITPEPQYSEQAPELIWQAFLKSILKVVTHLQHQPLAISISSAMHSLIPVDEHGEALMNMITWADNRSSAIATRIKNSAQGKLIYERTGTPIHAMSPLCKIIWLKENAPGIYQGAFKFVSIKEYIWFKLFHVFEIDHSIASATGLFDIRELTWNADALALCGILPMQLSAPVSTGYVRRNIDTNVATDLSLNIEMPFVIGASDGCMANLGSHATKPGVAALTIGTSGAIRVAHTKPSCNFQAMTFNYLLDENTFICGGPINNGGVILKWYVQYFLKKQLTSSADYADVLDDLEQTNAGADGLIFLPYLLGDRAPIWNSDACGIFFGISTQHQQEHFTRAVIEGICMSLYHIGTALEESGLTIDTIHVSGGFVRSHAWLQLLADIFNKPIVLISSEDASAIGAALMAMKSLGMIATYEEMAPTSSMVFSPNEKNHLVYAGRNFPLYRSLYKNLIVDMAVWSDFQKNPLEENVITPRQ
jgi:gluconokinase